MLWNRGTEYFMKRDYNAASRLFSAAMMYAKQDSKGKSARILAVCAFGVQEYTRYCSLMF